MAKLNVAKPPGVMAVSVAASIVSHILALAVPLALLQTYDRILPNHAYGTTFVLAVGVTIAILLEAVVRYARSVLFAYVGAAFEADTTVRLLDHVMRADSKAFHQLSIPDFSDAIRSAGEVRDFWSGNAAVALHELPFAVIYIALIAYIGSWLAVIPLAFTFLALLAALLISRSGAKAQHDARQAQLDRQKLAWGIFTGIVEAKAMAAETLLTRLYRDSVAHLMDATARVANRMAVIRQNGSLMAQLSTIGIVTAGAFMVIGGELTTGGLAACTLLAGRSVGPAMGAFSYLSRRHQKLEAEASIKKVLSLPLAPVWTEAGSAVTRRFAGGPITMSGPALHTHDGSVTIPQGTFVHIDVPNSPVGAMTMRTLARLEDSLGLSITFDGRPISAYDPQSFRERVTEASARATLIRGTLLDNLTLFSPNHEAAAIHLSKKLGLSTFVDSLRQGYMMPVGQGGVEMISPGIAARIGLVRALVREPLVLCLDNVDASLDLEGVAQLRGVLKGLKGRTTVLMVSSNPGLLHLTDMKVHVDRRKVET